MSCLLDTGILLRMADLEDRWHDAVADAVGRRGDAGENLVVAAQNIAEFCNVSTRPIELNGFGKSPGEAIAFVQSDIESICTVLPETDDAYLHLKRLISNYGVTGKQVHDARLVGIMLAWGIEDVLTVNERDFRRYEAEGIRVLTPPPLAE